MDIAWWHVVLGIFILLLILNPVMKAVFRRQVRKAERWHGSFDELVDAASDSGALDQLIRSGANLSHRTRGGDTPLHRAYFLDRQDAVSNLKDAGAPEEQPNFDGLLPHEMTAVAHAMGLIEEGVALIADDGRWREPQDGQRIWSALRKTSGTHYRVALDRGLPFTPDQLGRRHALLAIKVGHSGSETILRRLLNEPGSVDRDIAVDFLNSGNGTLRAEAERWARANSYEIIEHLHGGLVTWGSS